MDIDVAQHGELLNLGRLLLEDVCSDLVRYVHSEGDPARFEDVRIDREVALGPPGAFADLRVESPGEPLYFLEVKYGYDTSTLLRHIRRKYSERTPAMGDATKVVVVVDKKAYANWATAEEALKAALAEPLVLEVWDLERLARASADHFGYTIPAFAASELFSIRRHIDESKERLAFGDGPAPDYAELVLRQNLL